MVSVWKGTLRVHVLYYVTSLVTHVLAQVGRRSCRRQVRNTLSAIGLQCGLPQLKNICLYLLSVMTEYPKDPGQGMGILQNIQKSGYGTEVLQNSQKIWILWDGRTELTYVLDTICPCPWYFWHCRSELPEVPGTGISVVHNLHEFRVRVQMFYRTYMCFLQDDTGGEYPGYGLCVLAEHNLGTM